MARALPAPLASCPRCESPRSSDQQYCMDCGLKLPPADGALASFRRGWIRWFGWYPGDWTFPALVTLLIAAAGAAAAVELSRRDEGGTRTIAAPTAPPATNERAASASSTRPNGRTEWPAGESGWTVVLVSLPRELGRAAAKERAARAARAALPDVGFLLSDRFPSLHPGYYVVFTGIYQSRSEAEAAVPTARGRGFGGAYARPVVP